MKLHCGFRRNISSYSHKGHVCYSLFRLSIIEFGLVDHLSLLIDLS